MQRMPRQRERSSRSGRGRGCFCKHVFVAALVYQGSYLRRDTNDETMTTTKQTKAALALLPSSVLRSCCMLVPTARDIYMLGRRTETSRCGGSPRITTENDEAKCTKVMGWCLHERFPKGVTFLQEPGDGTSAAPQGRAHKSPASQHHMTIRAAACSLLFAARAPITCAWRARLHTPNPAHSALVTPCRYKVRVG